MIIMNNANGNVINLPENSVWGLCSTFKIVGEKIACSVGASFPDGADLIIARWDAETEEEARLQANNVKAFIANSFTLPVKMCVLDLVGIIKVERKRL